MIKKERKKRNERRHFLRLMQKIYGVLESGKWKIIYAKFENYRGYVLYEERLIILDPREDILLTLIHECLHVLFYEEKLKLKRRKNEEKEVGRLEKFCSKYLDQPQAFRLTELILKNLIMKNPQTIEGPD